MACSTHQSQESDGTNSRELESDRRKHDFLAPASGTSPDHPPTSSSLPVPSVGGESPWTDPSVRPKVRPPKHRLPMRLPVESASEGTGIRSRDYLSYYQRPSERTPSYREGDYQYVRDLRKDLHTYSGGNKNTKVLTDSPYKMTVSNASLESGYADLNIYGKSQDEKLQPVLGCHRPLNCSFGNYSSSGESCVSSIHLKSTTASNFHLPKTENQVPAFNPDRPLVIEICKDTTSGSHQKKLIRCSYMEPNNNAREDSFLPDIVSSNNKNSASHPPKTRKESLRSTSLPNSLSKPASEKEKKVILGNKRNTSPRKKKLSRICGKVTGSAHKLKDHTSILGLSYRKSSPKSNWKRSSSIFMSRSVIEATNPNLKRPLKRTSSGNFQRWKLSGEADPDNGATCISAGSDWGQDNYGYSDGSDGCGEVHQDDEDGREGRDGLDGLDDGEGGDGPYDKDSLDFTFFEEGWDQLLSDVGVGWFQFPLFLSLFIAWLTLGAHEHSVLLLNAPLPYACAHDGPSGAPISYSGFANVRLKFVPELENISCIKPLLLQSFSRDGSPYTTSDNFTSSDSTTPGQDNNLALDSSDPHQHLTPQDGRLPHSPWISMVPDESKIPQIPESPQQGRALPLESSSATLRYATVGGYASYLDWIWLPGIDKLFYVFLDDGRQKPPRLWHLTELDICPNVSYDTSVFDETLVSQFSLVCDRAWLRRVVEGVQHVGALIGAALGGLVADRWGRLFCVRVSMFLFAVSSAVCAASPPLAYWLLAWGATATTLWGASIALLVAAMESCPTPKRAEVGMLVGLPFSLGLLFLGTLGYFIRSWRSLFMAISFPAVILLPLSLVAVESAQWLVQRQEDSTAALSLLMGAVEANTGYTPFAGQVEDILNSLPSVSAPHASWVLLTAIWLMQGAAQGFLLPLALHHLPESPFLLLYVLASVVAVATVVSVALLPLGPRYSSLAVWVPAAGAAILLIVPAYVDWSWKNHADAALSIGATVMIFGVGWVLLAWCCEVSSPRWRCSAVAHCLRTRLLGVSAARLLGTKLQPQSVPWLHPCVAALCCVACGLLTLLLPLREAPKLQQEEPVYETPKFSPTAPLAVGTSLTRPQ